ncbi:MAG: DUF2314 domain-containing protein [Chitinophagaceae bacterium]|nr:DUF2314 domain-containing protein [Chitinophagaceae bacterium]
MVFACDERSSDKVERSGEPDVYQVADDDEAMNHAMEIARGTLKTFDSALKSGNPSYQKFSLKSKFDTPDGAEHIWVSDISIINGKHFGVVDNEPKSIPSIRIGDTIEVRNITDWFYIDNGILRGGYTIRVLRDKMSAEERKTFDAEYGVTIEE